MDCKRVQLTHNAGIAVRLVSADAHATRRTSEECSFVARSIVTFITNMNYQRDVGVCQFIEANSIWLCRLLAIDGISATPMCDDALLRLDWLSPRE
jgi:hypothetical protein